MHKVATPGGLGAPVARYLESLAPRPGAAYVLVNALGAGEYYGSNINGDFFPEEALIHAPEGWAEEPGRDRPRARGWPYGYPTFYFAHPYGHHRNKESDKAFGEVELVTWNGAMRRVELVVRLDKDKCLAFGGAGIWDKVAQGQYPDVSMGCRVPFDTCSICLDWDRYRKAQAGADPRRGASAADAILAVHKRVPIRGLSITRRDYCVHALKQMNQILPDGRKVFVYNDYPKFFDISFVFVGADRTAKTMVHLARPVAEEAQKVAAAEGEDPAEDAFKMAFLGKAAKNKAGEITKDVLPTPLAARAVPLVTRAEADLPRPLLDLLGERPLAEALATPSVLGIVLRPREFQRVVLVRLGQGALADALDRRGEVFAPGHDEAEVPFGLGDVSEALAALLCPHLAARSALGPFLEPRALAACLSPAPPPAPQKAAVSSSLSSDLLPKIASTYNGYRRQLMDLVASTQEILPRVAFAHGDVLRKVASAPAGLVFTPLTHAYLTRAYGAQDAPCGREVVPELQRGVGMPRREHVDHP